MLNYDYGSGNIAEYYDSGSIGLILLESEKSALSYEFLKSLLDLCYCVAGMRLRPVFWRPEYVALTLSG